MVDSPQWNITVARLHHLLLRVLFRNKIPLKCARSEWPTPSVRVTRPMAFKQVRNRTSLFRPWALGDSLKQGIPSCRETEKGNEIQLTKDDSSMKSLQAVSSDSSLFAPSAFRSVAPIPLTLSDCPSLPLPPQIPFLPKPSALDATATVGFDVQANSVIAWDSSPEISLLTSPTQFSPSLEQQSASRWKAKKQRPKRFQCPHCQVSFSNNGQLKGHIRIHTGERPFACNHPNCGKTFTRNEELTRHKRIHTGVRPHPCILCGKRFGRKDHLKKHVKTHQRPPAPAFHAIPYFVSWF